MAEVAPASVSPPPAPAMDVASPIAAETRQATPPPPSPPAPVDEPIAVDSESTTEPVVAESGTPAPEAPATPIVVDEEPQPLTAEELEQQANRKRKSAAAADESKKRGKRMFGLLTSTLRQAKTETTNLSGAAKKRMELEQRLASKLQGERAELEAKTNRERESKGLKLSVTKKEEEIARTDSIYQVRHATKLHLASFLCTTFTLPPPPPSTDGISVPFAPRLPHATRIPNPSASKPIYYLPYRLLPSQEDQIEDQIAAVKKSIRREKEDWEKVKHGKVDDLDDARRRRDERMEELARVDREARQKQRREEEEKRDQAKGEEQRQGSSAPVATDDKAMEVDGGAAVSEETPVEAAAAPTVDNGDDVEMDKAPEGDAVEPQSVDLEAKGSTGAEGKMEGEEDLEY